MTVARIGKFDSCAYCVLLLCQRWTSQPTGFRYVPCQLNRFGGPIWLICCAVWLPNVYGSKAFDKHAAFKKGNRAMPRGNSTEFAGQAGLAGAQAHLAKRLQEEGEEASLVPVALFLFSVCCFFLGGRVPL